ncbi:MAG: LysE family translocator, partial [Gemmatimonadota bacterium]
MPLEIDAMALVVGLFLLGVVSPGPNFLVVAERSMASGFRAGFMTALGVAAGDALAAQHDFLQRHRERVDTVRIAPDTRAKAAQGVRGVEPPAEPGLTEVEATH